MSFMRTEALQRFAPKDMSCGDRLVIRGSSDSHMTQDRGETLPGGIS